MSTGPTLLVASTGGHLTQLVQLAPRIEPNAERRVWVTFDTPQSRSLLASEKVEFVDFMAPRQWARGIANLPRAVRIFRRYRPGRVFSTGSGIALSFLPMARSFGARASYVESAARTEGPSLTGKVLSRTPGVRTYTQYENYADKRWVFGYSVFDEYPQREAHEPIRADGPKVLVLLGTLDFSFERLVHKVVASLPPGSDIAWQLGHTNAPEGLPGRHFAFAPASELAALASWSTVVVAHAGCGSAITALDNGVWPILVPRHVVNGEHIDDHQVQVARELERRGLANYVEVDDLTEELLASDFRAPRGIT